MEEKQERWLSESTVTMFREAESMLHSGETKGMSRKVSKAMLIPEKILDTGYGPGQEINITRSIDATAVTATAIALAAGTTANVAVASSAAPWEEIPPKQQRRSLRRGYSAKGSLTPADVVSWKLAPRFISYSSSMPKIKLQRKYRNMIDGSTLQPWSYHRFNRLMSLHTSFENLLVLGVCAMEKKTQSKPMKEILQRLRANYFEVVVFTDHQILHEDVATWPVCDALISFYSTGFPFAKVEKYIDMHKPFQVNDISSQQILLDRRKVYETLEKNGIAVPNYVVVNRGETDVPDSTLLEHDDFIVVDGKTIHKPFVEKPVDAENHNVYIYYPSSAGGGSKRLFRKVNNRSAEFYPNCHSIRQSGGSYIYEEFLSTQGIDVKVYAVGASYGHAEARKSPVLDGKVMRDGKGKEIRYPVILSRSEKNIVRKVCAAFKQTVCGFDLLRSSNGISYVCDVNGWSFVKSSKKYYDDCSLLLQDHILQGLPSKTQQKMQARINQSIMNEMPSTSQATDEHGFAAVDGRRDKSNELNSPAYRIALSPDPCHGYTTQSELHSDEDEYEDEDENEDANASGFAFDSVSSDGSNGSEPDEENLLRCVVGVIRHGDRYPKQKLKMLVWHDSFIQFYDDRMPSVDLNPQVLKVKAVSDLEAMLQLLSTLLQSYEWDETMTSIPLPIQEQCAQNGCGHLLKLIQMKQVLKRWEFSGINRKIQLQPMDWDAKGRISKLLLVCKWGGGLTPLGRRQSEELGKRFRRSLYPRRRDENVLRLHSTFQHDLKIYTSDEGRVQLTAAAFAKGFLELEGDSLTPILVSLVTTLARHENEMLDCSGLKNAKRDRQQMKERWNALFPSDACTKPVEESSRWTFEMNASLLDSCRRFGEAPLHDLHLLRSLLGAWVEFLKVLAMESTDLSCFPEAWQGDASHEGEAWDDVFPRHHDGQDDLNSERIDGNLYGGETCTLMFERWNQLWQDLYSTETNRFDLTKLPDIYDNIKYDMLHNPKVMERWSSSSPDEHSRGRGLHLYRIAEQFTQCLVPREYGVTMLEKQTMGQTICHSLLAKIRQVDACLVDFMASMESWKQSPGKEARSPIDFQPETTTTPGMEAREEQEAEHMGYHFNPRYAKECLAESIGGQVRTRLYFTSKSHVHALLNVLRYQALQGWDGHDDDDLFSPDATEKIDEIKEMSYLSHIVFRLFENITLHENDPKRFHVEISCSPGVQLDTERIQKVKEKHEVVTRYPLGDDVSVLVLNKLFGECSA